MPRNKSYELVSFDICPYVQRSVIILKHKRIDFKLTLIELSEPPQWFNEISPLGKVPLLLVREEASDKPTVLFESAVINEFLDEVTEPHLLPGDPLQRAFERAWIAASGELLTSMFPIMVSSDPDEIAEARKDIWDMLDRIEALLPQNGYFSPKGFSLVDAAFAPALMRLRMIRSFRENPHWSEIPKTKRWVDTLLGLPEVRESVPSDFREKFVGFLKKMDSPLLSELT